MKNSLIRWIIRYQYYLLAVIFVILAIVIRYYNFDNRIVYDSEQARTLLVTGDLINEKLTLIGREYFRTTSDGHKLFTGVIFNYLMILPMVIFKYDIYKLTFMFGMINIITGIGLYFVALKIFNKKVALLSLIIFLFNDIMIKHSLFVWEQNLIPILGILVLYFFDKLRRKSNASTIVVLGFLIGLGINLHYPVILFSIPVGLAVTYYCKNKLFFIPLYLFGIILGNFPNFVFDLRHDWYQFRVLIKYSLEIFSGNGQNFSYYYLFILWPTFCVLIAWIINKYSKTTFIISIIISIYILINLCSKWVSFTKPVEMPDNLRYMDVMKASDIIARDKPSKFNITTLFGFDARGYLLRYPLKYNFNYKPESEENYTNIDVLYVMTDDQNTVIKPSRFETQSFYPYKYEILGNVNDSYYIYKLTKK